MSTTSSDRHSQRGKCSAFEQSIHVTSHRAGDVPSGWRPALHEALMALRAIDCQKRAHIQLTSPRIADLNLDVGSTAPDPCIDGILRKLRFRTAGTCERCGQPGILRCMERTTQVMCAECAGPRLLRFWIKSFVRQMNNPVESHSPAAYRYDELPFQLRPMIPAHAWNKTGGTFNGVPDVSMPFFEILAYQRRFEEVGDALERMITADDSE